MEQLSMVVTMAVLVLSAYALGYRNGRNYLKIRNSLSRMEGVEYGIRLNNSISTKQGEALQQMMLRQVNEARKDMGLNTEEEILQTLKDKEAPKDGEQ